MKEERIAIQVDDLTVAYNYKPVLWDIDLKIPEGVMMAIVGPNGAGKSSCVCSSKRKCRLGFSNDGN